MGWRWGYGVNLVDWGESGSREGLKYSRQVNGGRGASLAQHRREGRPALLPGHLSMDTEQCAVVFSSVVSLMFLKLKLLLRLFRVGLQSSRQRRQCSRAYNRGTTESDKERWLLAGYLTFCAIRPNLQREQMNKNKRRCKLSCAAQLQIWCAVGKMCLWLQFQCGEHLFWGGRKLVFLDKWLCLFQLEQSATCFDLFRSLVSPL